MRHAFFTKASYEYMYKRVLDNNILEHITLIKLFMLMTLFANFSNMTNKKYRHYQFHEDLNQLIFSIHIFFISTIL